MRKAIALTAFKRPEYLTQVLDSLKSNNTSLFETMYLGIEPVSTDVMKVCSNIDFIPTVRTINHKILGVRDNPFQTMKRAFDAGFDLVWQLEDDVVLSPDAAELIEAYSKYEHKNNYLCLNLYNPSSWDEPETVYASKGFNALSMAITKEQWNTHFAPNFYSDQRGWDWSIIGLLQRTHLTNLTPALSRSHHIGRDGGTHYRPAQHDELYIHNPWKQDSLPVEFKFKI